MRIQFLIVIWCGSGFLFDADADPTFHPDADADADPDPSFQRKAQTLEKLLKYALIPYILARHLQIDADPDEVTDPAYNFEADPGSDRDPDFYLMRMRIQVNKMMRIHADPDSDADPDPITLDLANK